MLSRTTSYFGTLFALFTMSDVSGFSALAGFPLQQPPSGVVSNFVNPPSTGFEFVVAGSVFMFLMIVFFALRMYGKLTVARKLKWDDCMFETGSLCYHFTDSSILRYLHNRICKMDLYFPSRYQLILNRCLHVPNM